VVEAQLGYGGMGCVYRAIDKKTNRRVALKILHPSMLSDTSARRRFIREGRNSLSLRHPHIVQVTDFALSKDGLLYMEMEYLQGESLADIVMKTGPLTLGRFVDVFVQVCNALIYAHEQGFVHRDIKPSNIMIGPSRRGGDRVKLVDFGVAKLLNDSGMQELTFVGEFIGSPCYMSPEQCEGADSVDGRSDLYSLGCVMYEAITGVRAFRGPSSLRIMHKQVHEMPAIFSKARPDLAIPAWLEHVVFKTLAKNPRERYDNAHALKLDLLDGRFQSSQDEDRATNFEVLPWESLQHAPFDETASGTNFDAAVSGSHEAIVSKAYDAAISGTHEAGLKTITRRRAAASTLAVGTVSNPIVFKSFNWSVLKLLSYGGMIQEEDLLEARQFQQHNGGDLGRILVILGKIDNKTLLSAVKAQRLVELGEMKTDRAIYLLHYCQRMRADLEEAITELGDNF